MVIFLVENARHDELGQVQLQVQPIQKSVTEGGELRALGSGRFTSKQKPVTCCISGWIGLEVGLDGTVNLGRTWIRSPERPVYSGQGTGGFLLYRA